MSGAVDEYWRQVRQGIFDRMAVTAVVSDRLEHNLAWPVASIGTVDGQPYGIQRNPTALPRAYVVPRALSSPMIPRTSSLSFDPATLIPRS